MIRAVSGCLLVATLAACGVSGPTPPRGQRSIITAEEIASLNVSSAWEAIQHLRPDFLRSRGTVSIRNPNAQYPVVYVNGMRAGGLDELRSVRAGDVQNIRFISASDATTRWGTGHAGGVIEITTKT